MSKENIPQNAGAQKVAEYVARIKSGESRENIERGLPPSFLRGIEIGLEKGKDNDEKIEETKEENINANVEPEPVILTKEEKLSQELAEMTQDEYAKWLSENMLDERLDDISLYNQIVLRPEYRALTSQERVDILLKVKDTPKYAEFKKRIEELDQFWLLTKRLQTPGIKTVGSGNEWSNFEINNGTVGHSESKGYLTFKDPSVALTPSKLSNFMQRLKDIGYNGQVKVPTLPSGLFFRFDNLVFHGDTNKDTEQAMLIAQEIFSNDLSGTQIGQDGEDSEGKHRSHSELLAKKVSDGRKSRSL